MIKILLNNENLPVDKTVKFKMILAIPLHRERTYLIKFFDNLNFFNPTSGGIVTETLSNYQYEFFAFSESEVNSLKNEILKSIILMME
jgi:hypothetical protein